MKYFFFFLILIHGLIHIAGFFKAFDLVQLNELKESISKLAGVLWVFAAFLFIISAVFYLIEEDYWWMLAAPAVILSQILIILAWNDAKFGTVINIILLIPLIIAAAERLPGSFKNSFKAEAEEGLKRSSRQSILTLEDIKHLPLPVRKYIIYSGAIGKEKIQNFRAVLSGEMKPSPQSSFLEFRAEQYDFFDKPARIFYVKSRIYGIPFDGFHLYKGPSATMRIKIASLFKAADAYGPEMNKGETVTLFNDICIFAPAALISKNIKWEDIDSLTVKAVFTNQGNKISAILYFNEKGELINFSSNDRYESADGKVYKNYKWTTPVKNYEVFNDRKIASYAEAVWHEPEGEFCYGKFKVEEINYNCRKFR
ncbi:MAG TPA: DUF6544 family protein [Ignavibacteriaceae bacterium]|nr:DUF6544 family protein [Ignavibacteriaceae bacterium]